MRPSTSNASKVPEGVSAGVVSWRSSPSWPIMALNSHVWAQDAPQPSPPPGAAQASLEDPEWFQGAVRKAGPGVTMPFVGKSAKPTCTRQAMDARVQGEVLLDARVDAKGRVTHVRVVRSLAMLDA